MSLLTLGDLWQPSVAEAGKQGWYPSDGVHDDQAFLIRRYYVRDVERVTPRLVAAFNEMFQEQHGPAVRLVPFEDHEIDIAWRLRGDVLPSWTQADITKIQELVRRALEARGLLKLISILS